MSSFKKTSDLPGSRPGSWVRTGKRLAFASLLIVIVLLVAACSPAAEPTAAPAAEPTTAPLPADTPAAEILPTEVIPTDAPAAEILATDAPAAEAMITPSVTVADQNIVEDQVIIAEVVSDGPGWLVIHTQVDGKPGPILGYSPVASGANAAVAVGVDTSSATATLYAMLHTDAGVVGTWEFPNGPDTPVTVGEQMVSPAFTVGNAAAALPSSPTAVPVVSSDNSAGLPAGAVVVTGDEAEVEIEDFSFNPPVLVIRPGTTVKFANKDTARHTATSDTGLFDSGYLSKGDEFFFTFTEAGTYPYYCLPHGGPGGQGMSAVIIVQP